MIYVAGYTFTFRPGAPQQNTNISIQERMAGRKVRNTTPFDERFIVGHSYRVGLIRKFEDEDNKPRVRYLFVDMNEAQDDIDVVLPDTGAGDEYIAAISGTMTQLINTRQAINKAAQNNDF